MSVYFSYSQVHTNQSKTKVECKLELGKIEVEELKALE